MNNNESDMNKNNKQKGFTLIEIMITVGILGIISSIAVPSYMQHVLKSKRTEPKTELLRLAQLQESYYVQNLSYAKTLDGGLGFPSAVVKTESALYNVWTDGLPFSCDGTNANPCTGYNVVAAVIPGKSQGSDKKCTKFRLNNTGFKGAQSETDTDFTSAKNIKECWG